VAAGAEEVGEAKPAGHIASREAREVTASTAVAPPEPSPIVPARCGGQQQLENKDGSRSGRS
jgi:hypothetical protein